MPPFVINELKFFASCFRVLSRMAEDMITCIRCATCCLPGLSLVCDADLERWKREKRDDILHIYENRHPVWAGDHIISSENGCNQSGCPFLQSGDGGFSCSIYDTRPDVCRNFIPGSSRICPLFEELSGNDRNTDDCS